MALDPYEQLGVARNATDEQIVVAWRRKAQALHPDRHPDDPYATTRFQLAKEAFDILSDPARRASYDETGSGKADNLQQRSMALLAQALMSVLGQMNAQNAYDMRGFNLIGTLNAMVQTQVGECGRKKAAIGLAINGLEKTLKRFRRKSAGQNLLGDIIGAQIEKAKAERLKLDLALEEAAAALKLLAEYEDLPEEAQHEFVKLFVGGDGRKIGFASSSASVWT